MSDIQEWYYLEEGDRKGPFDLAIMRQLWAAGVVSPQSHVARGGDTVWSSAEQLLAPLVGQGPSHIDVVGHQGVAAPAKAASPAAWLAGRSSLLWALASLLMLLIPGIFLWDQLCESRGPQDLIPERGLSGQLPANMHLLMPSDRPEVKEGTHHALIYTLACLGAAVGVASTSRLHRRLRERNRKASKWAMMLLVMSWLGTTVWCAVLAFISLTGRSASMFSQLYLFGVVGKKELIVIAVVLGLTIAFAAFAIMTGRREAKRSVGNVGPSPFLVTIACNISMIALILSLFVALIPGLCLTTRQPVVDPDKEVAAVLLDAIDSFQQQSGHRLVEEWVEPPKEPIAVPNPSPWAALFGSQNGTGADMSTRAKRNADGDIVGISTGRLIDLLGDDESSRSILTRTTFVDPEFREKREIEDVWNLEPFRIVLDANADGRIRIGHQEIQAKAAVWSVGWNGKDEQGRGDDVLMLRQ